MPELTRDEKLRLLTILLESRHGDLREQSLNRQGKGHFHVSGMGHEGLAAISIQMQEDDYIVPYYRDRALVLGRGVSSRQLAIDYFAKAKGESHGRQMPSHYSCAEKHIWSVPTPTGSQLLPACGIAWASTSMAKTPRLSPPLVMRRHDRATFTRQFVSRRRRNCQCCLS